MANKVSESTGKSNGTPILLLANFFLVLAVWLIRYWQVLGPASFASPLYNRVFQPLVSFSLSEAKQGRAALWNPYSFLGSPVLPGLCPSIFYPLNGIFFLANTETSCLAFIFAHLLISASGLVVVFRHLKLGSAPLLVATQTAVLAEIYLVGDFNLALAAYLAWLPYVVFAMLRVISPANGIKPHGAGAVVVFALFLALMLASGAILLSAATILLLLAIAVVQAVRVQNKAVFIWSLSAITLAIGLSLAALLPSLAWLSQESQESQDKYENAYKRLIQSFVLAPASGIQAKGTSGNEEEVDFLETSSIMKAIDDLNQQANQLNHQYRGRYLNIAVEGMPQSDSTMPNRNVSFGVCNALGYQLTPTESARRLASIAFAGTADGGSVPAPETEEDRQRLLRFCQVTSTPLLVSNQTLQSMNFGTTSKKGIYRLEGILPRAYALSGWHWVKNEDEAQSMLYSAAFDPGKTVLVEKDSMTIDEERLDTMPLTQVNPPSGPPHQDSDPEQSLVLPAEIMRYTPEHVSISVKLDKASFVVLTDSFYRGWYANVDGMPAPSYRANGFARAVFVQAGSHLIEYDLKPSALTIGVMSFWVSLVNTVVLTFAWLWRLLAKIVRWLSSGKFE